MFMLSVTMMSPASGIVVKVVVTVPPLLWVPVLAIVAVVAVLLCLAEHDFRYGSAKLIEEMNTFAPYMYLADAFV